MHSRRDFFTSAAAAAGFAAAGTIVAQPRIERIGGPQVKISLNAYSFNRPLSDGTMTLDELLEFSAEVGFKAVDLTAYYFPGYPDPPDNEYLYQIKRKAYLLGLDISGTGVRTDFTTADAEKRSAAVDHVAVWSEVACKLGAPSLRIFAGAEVKDRESAIPRVVESIRDCAEWGGKHGVMMVLQNHFAFIKTPKNVFQILDQVNSKWLAVHLDVGSFRSSDPYEEIARVAPYAATWQIKESVYLGNQETRVDLNRISAILSEAEFRGYVLVETLGRGDPKEKVKRFFQEVQEALG